MSLLTWWTWVWATSRSWWWTGKPGVLQSMGSQRVEGVWMTKQKAFWKYTDTRISIQSWRFYSFISINFNIEERKWIHSSHKIDIYIFFTWRGNINVPKPWMKRMHCFKNLSGVSYLSLTCVSFSLLQCPLLQFPLWKTKKTHSKRDITERLSWSHSFKISTGKDVHAKSSQSCPTLCNPVDCSPPGSSVHGILQARTLEWAAIFSSRGSFQPRVRPASLMSPALAGVFFTSYTT